MFELVHVSMCECAFSSLGKLQLKAFTFIDKIKLYSVVHKQLVAFKEIRNQVSSLKISAK